MAKFVWSLVLMVVVFCRHLNAKENVNKRMLLSDPDLVGTQVQAIQRELEKVKSQLSSQVNTIAAQQAEINSLKRATNNLHTTQGNILILIYSMSVSKDCQYTILVYVIFMTTI